MLVNVTSVLGVITGTLLPLIVSYLTEASVRYETINGKRVPVITPKTEVTLTNTETGQEYMSDAEALADVQNASTETKAEHIRRDVNVTVEEIKIGAGFNISD